MHILFATDGSEGARTAGEALARLQPGPDTRVTVLHVVTRYVPNARTLPHGMLEALRADEDTRARTVVEEAVAALGLTGWPVAARTEEGPPSRRITEVAAEAGADLIVTGALGLTGWLRVLLGSTSMAVVKHAPCPVWVVKRLPKAGRTDVLVATDGSAHARQAIRVLCGLGLAADTAVHLVHVVPSVGEQLDLTGGPLDVPVPGPLHEIGAQLRERGEGILKEDAATLGATFAQVHPVLVEGDPRRRILQTARETEADLVVMGSQGLAGAREFLLGSVSHKVLKHTKASVLIAPLPPR